MLHLPAQLAHLHWSSGHDFRLSRVNSRQARETRVRFPDGEHLLFDFSIHRKLATAYLHQRGMSFAQGTLWKLVQSVNEKRQIVPQHATALLFLLRRGLPIIISPTLRHGRCIQPSTYL
jgi:hypothetical protein